MRSFMDLQRKYLFLFSLFASYRTWEKYSMSQNFYLVVCGSVLDIHQHSEHP